MPTNNIDPLDEILLAHENHMRYDSLGEAAHEEVGFLDHSEAKQKLLKLIDKEVTRSRIDELKLIPMVASKKVFVGVKAKDSLNVYLKQRLAELQTIQEEGTDNENY